MLKASLTVSMKRLPHKFVFGQQKYLTKKTFANKKYFANQNKLSKKGVGTTKKHFWPKNVLGKKKCLATQICTKFSFYFQINNWQKLIRSPKKKLGPKTILLL